MHDRRLKTLGDQGAPTGPWFQQPFLLMMSIFHLGDEKTIFNNSKLEIEKKKLFELT
jgi:hypothetical protein